MQTELSLWGCKGRIACSGGCCVDKMCRLSCPLVISDRVKSWISSTYWTKTTLFPLNLSLQSSSPTKPFLYPVSVHSMSVILICWHYFHFDRLPSHTHTCLWTNMERKVSLCFYAEACVSMATQPGEWQAENLDRRLCCCDTMWMNVCRYDIEKTKVHLCLCSARSPHSPERRDLGDIKVCMAVTRVYYLEEVGSLLVWQIWHMQL